MTAVVATLTNASVNSGTAVSLQAHSVSYGWKNITGAPPIQGRYDITEADYVGFENPIITITGIINVQSIASNTITQVMLINFATVATASTLTLGAGTTPVYLGGRPSAGYVTTGSQTLSGTIKVRVQSFDISFGTQETVHGQGWTYTLVLTETNE